MDSSPKVSEKLEPVLVTRPHIFFKTLSGLKKQGVYFVDTETGNYIDGLIYLPSIGLTLKPPQQKNKRQCYSGFLSQFDKEVPKKPSEDDTFELDAVLYFQYNGPECLTGYIKKEDSFLFFIKIWNDNELVSWEKIIENIVSENTVKDKNGNDHRNVQFVISSTFVPNSPSGANKLVIPKPRSDESVNAVSPFRFRRNNYVSGKDQTSLKPRY